MFLPEGVLGNSIDIKSVNYSCLSMLTNKEKENVVDSFKVSEENEEDKKKEEVKIYNVMVVGIGSIGCKSVEIESKNPNAITSWCQAISNHPQFKLTSCVDPEWNKAYKATQRYGGAYYGSLRQANIFKQNPDIIIVSAPTQNHKELLLEILQFNPRLVICEKPFCMNKEEAEEISYFYKKVGIPLLINYTRRFLQAMVSLKQSFDLGYFGEIYSCTCYYTRGTIRDGSHFIDLANYFFGRYLDGFRFGKGIDDYSKEDLTYSATLMFEKCGNVEMVAVDGRKFDVFDIIIMTEKGKIELLQHGQILRFYDLIPEKTHGNYNSLNIDYTTKETGLERGLLNVLDNVIDHLENNVSIICDSEDGVKVHKVLKNLLGK